MILNFFPQYKPNEIEELPINYWQLLVAQALNIGVFRAGGKLDLQDTKSKYQELRAKYEALVKAGILNAKKR